MGHKCSNKGVEPDKRLIQVVQDVEVPQNIGQIQAFFGLVNYYRKFIKDFAKKASPLYSHLKEVEAMSKSKKAIHWNTESQVSFEQLKTDLVTPPVLAYP